jgi:hypothetical protein
MNAQDVLKYGHLTLLHTIEGLPESEWATSGVCGVWSVRDIIAHLASYEHVLAEVLSTFLSDSGSAAFGQDASATPTLKAFLDPSGQFNDAQVALRKDRTSADVLAEYKGVQERVMALVEQISAEVLRKTGTLPWYGMEYALDDYIVYAYYGHKREHSAQIAVFRDRVAK